MNPPKFKVGDSVKHSTAYRQGGVEYGTPGVILEVHPEQFGPGEATVKWDNGHVSKISGYHFATTGHRPPIDDRKALEAWLET